MLKKITGLATQGRTKHINETRRRTMPSLAPPETTRQMSRTDPHLGRKFLPKLETTLVHEDIYCFHSNQDHIFRPCIIIICIFACSGGERGNDSGQNQSVAVADGGEGL